MSRLWMISYDIAHNKRRRRVERALRSVGERIQESVFECWLSTHELNALLRQLEAEIKTGEDRIGCYPLCRWCEESVVWHGLGRRSEDPDLWIV